MSSSPVDPSFGLLIYEISHQMRKRLEQRAKGLGLTRAQWQALGKLKRHAELSQAQLADMLDLEPITISRLLDRMEEAGLISRRPHPTDRRIRLVSVTETAKPILDEFRVLVDELHEEVLGHLSAAERAELIDRLTAIRAILAEPTSN
ncbi:MAG: MarR family winged helix-turn-helix transcriptional regulator [Ferrovibrionaceae bacterium]